MESSSSSFGADWTQWLPRALTTPKMEEIRQSWYHVRIQLKESDKKDEPLVAFNLSESSLKRDIAIPYNQGNIFAFNGRAISPQSVSNLSIITTSQRQNVNRFEDLQGEDVTNEFVSSPPIATDIGQKLKKVFIVHGHDDASKNELSSFLFRLGLTPIILHEQPNAGKTVVEKFEQYSADAGYAFVLLTPDDIGGNDRKNLSSRARQNVILELGYFMGKLGRDKICGLYKQGVEIPSDVLGVLYLKYEQSIQERAFDILQELAHAGYSVNIGDEK